MRPYTNVNVLIALLLVLAASAAWNLQETHTVLDWLYHQIAWLIQQIDRNL